MTETTMVIGGVAVVGLAALAAWFVTSKAKPATVVTIAPVTPSTSPGQVVTGPPRTGGDIASQAGSITPGAIQQTPFQDANGQALAQQLANERAENARREAEARERERLAGISNLRGTLAAIENAQVIALTDIQANETNIQTIGNDQSGLSGMIDLVRKEGYASCDAKGWDIFGACHGMVDRDSADPKVSWSGHVRWANEIKRRQDEQRRLLTPKQANLARLEEQFKGATAELKNRYGVTYIPVSSATHEYAQAHSGR